MSETWKFALFLGVIAVLWIWRRPNRKSTDSSGTSSGWDGNSGDGDGSGD